jgi:hypothetical protein
LSELYIENRKRAEFFLYTFADITCGSGGGNNYRHTAVLFVMRPYLHRVEMQTGAK